MGRVLVWSGILLLATSCFAQKNELDMVLGNSWSFNSNTTVTRGGFPPLTFRSGRASNLTYEIGVARQLASFRPVSLSLELTAAGFPASFTNFASVFVTPAAKFTLLPRGRISPFASAGVGFVHLERGGVPNTNGVGYQFGGGVDVKTRFRFLSLRAEARDFLASQSGFADLRISTPGVTATGSFRNHVLLGGGAVLRF